MTQQSLAHVVFMQRNNRFLVLLTSLVVYFILNPVVEGYVIATVVLNLFFMLILLSGVYAIADTRRPLLISLGLATLNIIFRWMNYFYNSDLWELSSHSLAILFFTYIALHILKFIFRQRFITAELIYAALAVYFILGLCWASIYQLIEISTPDSFAMANAESYQQSFGFNMWYFSMVTLSTLGYGDIAPVTMIARVFVVLEAIIGQFYLAVLIASLIGRRIAQENS